MVNEKEYTRLCYVKNTLRVLSAGLKLSGIRVKDLAESIGAPQKRWTSKGLLKYVEVVITA